MAKIEEEQPKSTAQTESRIPSFTTIEEEAEFWDTHDSTEFEDEWEEVTDVKFVRADPCCRPTIDHNAR